MGRAAQESFGAGVMPAAVHQGQKGAFPSIGEMPAQERPYEKLRVDGVKALSDTDLLAVLIRSGQKGKNAVQLAHWVMAGRDGLGGLDYLASAEPEDLATVQGLGPIKSAQICAAVELGKRCICRHVRPSVSCHSPEAVWQLMREALADAQHEDFYVLYCDTQNRLLRRRLISRGGLSSLVIQPRDILRLALRISAASMVLCHNHPSGEVKPSREDRESTRRICEAAACLGLRVLDHVIIGADSFFSFRREGLLEREA